MAKQGKRLKAVYAGFDREKAYGLEEAVKLGLATQVAENPLEAAMAMA